MKIIENVGAFSENENFPFLRAAAHSPSPHHASERSVPVRVEDIRLQNHVFWLAGEIFEKNLFFYLCRTERSYIFAILDLNNHKYKHYGNSE